VSCQSIVVVALVVAVVAVVVCWPAQSVTKINISPKRVLTLFAKGIGNNNNDNQQPLSAS